MVIDNFHGHYYFLSNFSESPFWAYGKRWPTVEHAFQAIKCKNRADFEAVHKAETPGVAKRLGRRAELIDMWDYKRNGFMKHFLEMKFLQNDDLLAQLLATGDAELIEGTTWHDNYWGNCTCEKCEDKPGQNHLGKMLMDIRHNARSGNYIWCIRDMENGGEITQYFKTRARALKAIQAEYKKHNATVDNPYEYNGWRLDVVCMTE